jgi:multidrug efflux system membrane fusion protein
VVRDGLKPGEQIVVNGLQRVKAGAPIRAETVPMLASVTPAKDAKVAQAGSSTKE